MKNIYSDYQKMCDYVHGTDLSIKWLNLHFMIHIINQLL